MIHVLNPIHPNRNQKPNLCAATCLQMVLDRRGIDYGYSLENLALELGLYIDERDKDMFGEGLRRRALKHGNAKIGLIFDDFLQSEKPERIETNWGIKSGVYLPSQLGWRRTKELFIREIDNGNDLMVNHRLEPFNGRTDGHYVLVFAFDDKENDVYVSDPSPFVQEYWKAKLSRFLYAMKPIWEEDDNRPRERGFVVFSGPMNREKDKDLKRIDDIVQGTQEYRPVDARIRRRTPTPIPYRFCSK